MSNNPPKLPNNIIILHVLLDEVYKLVVCNDLLIHIVIDGALELDVVTCPSCNNEGTKMLSICMFIHNEYMAN